MSLLASQNTLLSSLKENELLGTVVPHDFKPSILLNVQYPTCGKIVSEGNALLIQDAKEEPVIRLSSFSSDESTSATYTIVLTDPDAPSRHDQKFGQWRHWVLPGLKPELGQSTVNSAPESNTTAPYQELQVSKTLEAATPYVGPGPGPGTGVHRYVFLLFKEPEGYTILAEDVGGHTKEERRHWNAIEFAKVKGLELVGVNFFLVDT